ncbi:MAG: hypothetical protein WCD89_17260 [Anaerocolumna sp.]
MKIFKRAGAIALGLVLLTGLGFYNPDITKASSRLETITALELTEDMKLGWNLGNTLDCTNLTISAGGTVSFGLQGTGTAVSDFSYTLE